MSICPQCGGWKQIVDCTCNPHERGTSVDCDSCDFQKLVDCPTCNGMGEVPDIPQEPGENFKQEN